MSDGRLRPARSLVADDAEVTFDAASQRDRVGGRVLRYESCYHIYDDCGAADRIAEPVRASRREAVADGRLMCGLCRARMASGLREARGRSAFWDAVEDGCVTGDEAFELHGDYEQTLLVSALRRVAGAGGAMERLVRGCVAVHASDAGPSTAALLAREIREWWCEWVWEGGAMASAGHGLADACDWVGLLGDLDRRAACVSDGAPYAPEVPFAARCRSGAEPGVRSWDDLPEALRPVPASASGTGSAVGSVVTLAGVAEQAALVASATYCFGRSSYMPSLTCEVLRRRMDGMCAEVAAAVALEVRTWWVDEFDFDWPLVGRESGFDTVGCWLSLLGELDGRAGFAYGPERGIIGGWDGASGPVRPAVPVRKGMRLV